MATHDDADPFERAFERLTPDARAALTRALAHALDEPGGEDEVLATDLVNTDAEAVTAEDAAASLGDLVARMSAGTRTPMVRIDGDGAAALLVSPDHLWTL